MICVPAAGHNQKKGLLEVGPKTRAEDEIRTRDPRLGKAMRYRCATSARGVPEMISNPTHKGKRTEARVLSALVDTGKSVLMPWNDERFDFLVYENGVFQRVQVKTGCLKDGYVLFRTVSVHTQGRHRRTYEGEVDFFAVYCPDNKKCYLVPADSLPKEMASLRLTPPRNGQTRGIRWARDFELTPLFPPGC
jgi:hypothetical protein